jgi:hypothetical protein
VTVPDAGAIVAAAFVAATGAEGLEPDPRLRLLNHLDPVVPAPGVEIHQPTDLGRLRERLVSAAERTRRGAWYTPDWLAAELVRRAVDGEGPVVDPACGGGVFLLAAAGRLLPGRTPAGVVDLLWGTDIDDLAVAVTEAALWWWSARHGEASLVPERLVVGDALTTEIVPLAAAVVGNPPFLGQLRTSTASTEERREVLRRRFGDALQPYTDESWLFLLAAVERTRPGGRIALVQPVSVLSARDAGAVRAAVDERAALLDVWVDEGSAFDAAVTVCAPILERRAGPSANDWGGPLAESLAVPTVELDPGRRLGDEASIVAGFRDEYYGLVGAVHEGGDGPLLVTSGAIDPLHHRTDADVRFAKQRWSRPTIDPDAVQGRARRWLDAQVGAKLLVATQTRVVEAVADPDGRMVASVPVIVVRPRDPGRLWHLAAALHAPVVSAWMLRRSAGTALSPGACKPTAALLTELPLPVDDDAWDEAAHAARGLAGGTGDWAAFGAAADRAYGTSDQAATDWWLERLPLR